MRTSTILFFIPLLSFLFYISISFATVLTNRTHKGYQVVKYDGLDESEEDEDYSDLPTPPVNITASTEVLIDAVKLLETTISWDADEDPRRLGFYLRVNAIGSDCIKDFDGYYNQNVDRDARKFVIPQYHNHNYLEIKHNCTYEVKMQSKPYVYIVPQFVSITNFTVPICIDGYCDCDLSPIVPSPENIHVNVFENDSTIKAQVNWKYPLVRGATHFHFSIYERYNHGNPQFAAIETKIMDINPPFYVIGYEGETSFSAILPVEFRPNETYTVSVFALNEQMCASDETKKEFKTIFKEESWISKKINAGSVNKSIRPESPDNGSFISNGSASDAISRTLNESREEGQGPDFTEMKSAILVPTPTLILTVGVALVTAVLLACCTLLCTIRRCFVKRKKTEIEKSSIIPWSMAHSSHSILETNILYRAANAAVTAPYDCEIPFSQIQIGGVIGQGAFGMVCMGTVIGVKGYSGPTTVAVKQLRANADENERTEFKAEMDIMKQVGRHPNIVALYGCCKEPNHQCMVMEYVPFGDLKHYLQNLRKQVDLAVLNMKTSMHAREVPTSLPPSLHSSFVSAIEDPSPSADLYHLDPTELQSFATQVANGMAHIESLGIIHRDLAARNILVGRDNQLKISDFGLSRYGVYVKTTKGVIPLRWLSIEAIQRNIYSTKSDVWAYGVVLWEICTLGGFPYPTVSDKDILKYLQQGNRLEKPISCTNEIYDVMMQCWAHNPSDRPSFAYLCEHLNDLNNQQCPYVEFVPNEELPPPEGYCVLADHPATHAHPSALSLSAMDASTPISTVA